MDMFIYYLTNIFRSFLDGSPRLEKPGIYEVSLIKSFFPPTKHIKPCRPGLPDFKLVLYNKITDCNSSSRQEKGVGWLKVATEPDSDPDFVSALFHSPLKLV